MNFKTFLYCNAYGGMSYDRYMQRNDDSTTHKLKTAYWATKQAVFKKLGKKEDEYIVASDSQLDSKLETCDDLSYLTDRYMECICVLSQIENEFGRFLKKQSSSDKTRAGDMMNVTGRSLGHSSQQRLLLRAPLERFYQEVNTFRHRAVADTNETLKKMESRRTDYRGSLMWMKKVSEQLDPDTHKQLDKFRKVQAHVKKSKDSFDKIKIDSMQKIDLLSASRCNMLSQALVGYQNALINFWDKTSKTMSVISESFKGYQYYEFSMLKELNVENRKLADDDSSDKKSNPSDFLGNLISENEDDLTEDSEENKGGAKGISDYFNSLCLESPSRDFSHDPNNEDKIDEKIDQDNLLNNETVSKEDKEFFSQIFNFGDESHGVDNMPKPLSSSSGLDFTGEMDANEFDDFQGINESQNRHELNHKNFLPSQLWNQNSFNFGQPISPNRSSSNFGQSLTPSLQKDSEPNSTSKNASDNKWMDLFSELDPSSNPDKLCKKPDDIAEV